MPTIEVQPDSPDTQPASSRRLLLEGSLLGALTLAAPAENGLHFRRRRGNVLVNSSGYRWLGHVEALLSEEVASTEAKQSSGGTGTTKYENSLAPRGASRHCNRVCAYYQRLLILFTCRIHMAVGDS
jgi:hypothetical protein